MTCSRCRTGFPAEYRTLVRLLKHDLGGIRQEDRRTLCPDCADEVERFVASAALRAVDDTEPATFSEDRNWPV